ncbi:DgyrCDS3824 [Dimorphilus gyrociliatus]|uniref:DgyrCDS3824 n=1 Tax=Dimorphilus gyrociliatus TaxID=2664684 RepID=A0A7I8VH83_9ANNE|nr:DgyrCDS3824 [Dimorphilus gyrociliatus]
MTTFNQLRREMAAQSKATKDLQFEFGLETSPKQESQSHTSDSTIFSSSLTNITPDSFMSRSSSSVILPYEQLEEKLKYTQTETNDLKKRLSEILKLNNDQKESFRSTIANLKGNLQEAIIARDSLLENKKKESLGHDSVMRKLQKQLKYLEGTNKMQDETIKDLTDKVEKFQNYSAEADTAIYHLKNVLRAQLERRQKDVKSIPSSSISCMVECVEKELKEMEFELENKAFTIQQLENDISEMKASNERKIRELTYDHELSERRIKVNCEHDVQSINEKLEMMKKQSGLLKEQIANLEKQYRDDINQKESAMNNLKSRLFEMEKDYAQDRHLWKEKQNALEVGLDEAQKEAALSSNDKMDTAKKYSVLESTYNEMKTALTRMECEIEHLTKENKRLTDSETALQEKANNLFRQNEKKQEDLDDLRGELKRSEKDAKDAYRNAMSTLDREKYEHTNETIRKLEAQVEVLTKKLSETQVSYEQVKMQYNTSESTRKDNSSKLSELESLIIQFKAENERLTNENVTLADDFKRFSEEKDYFSKLCNERNEELVNVRKSKDKLTIQLEERNSSFETLKEQNVKLSQMADIQAKSNNSIRDERDSTMKQLREAEKELAVMKRDNEERTKVIARYEDEIKDIKKDREGLASQVETLTNSKKELEDEMSQIADELKSTQYDLGVNLSEKDQCIEKFRATEQSKNEEIDKLKEQVKALMHDTRLAKKALKLQEKLDGKAVKVAGKVQKEVTEKRREIDSLNSRIRWFEDCFENFDKEKRILVSENEKLCEAIEKSLSRNENLAQELMQSQNDNERLVQTIHSLEKVIDSVQMERRNENVLEAKYAQDVAKLKLKHEIEKKELEGKLKKDLPPKKYSNVEHDIDAVQNGESISTSDIVRFVGELKSLVEQLNNTSNKTSNKEEYKQDKSERKPEEDGKQKKRYQEELERVHKKQDELQKSNEKKTRTQVRTSTASSPPKSECTSLEMLKDKADPEILCRRIESKIKALSSIGGKLIRDNEGRSIP